MIQSHRISPHKVGLAKTYQTSTSLPKDNNPVNPVKMLEGKSIDLASNSSQELDFDTYIKSREKKHTQYFSETKSMREPRQLMG